MTDILDKLPDYELTDEEHEALLLRSEHAIGPLLSPAARAVLDAFGKHPLDYDCPSQGLLYGALPAALRAAADQVVPTDELYARSCCEFTADSIRNALLAIADELEQLGG